MAVALLIISTLAVAELFIRLPILNTVRQSTMIASKSATLIRADKISDHWKERALPAYSGALFMHTLRLAAMLVAAFAPVIVALLIAPLFDAPLMGLFVSWPGVTVSIVVAAIYVFVRMRLVT